MSSCGRCSSSAAARPQSTFPRSPRLERLSNHPLELIVLCRDPRTHRFMAVAKIVEQDLEKERLTEEALEQADETARSREESR
jgi:hypothetical protein